MEYSNPKARLIEFVKSLGIGQTAFEDKIGLSRGAISKMTVNSSFTSRVIEKIKAHCPQLNISWLLTGEGEMLKREKKQVEDSPDEPVTSDTAEQDATVQYKLSDHDKYVLLLERTNRAYEKNNEALINITDKVARALDDIYDMKTTIQSLQQTIGKLTEKNNAGDMAAPKIST